MLFRVWDHTACRVSGYVFGFGLKVSAKNLGRGDWGYIDPIPCPLLRVSNSMPFIFFRYLSIYICVYESSNLKKG